jgi:hypothetical protein
MIVGVVIHNTPEIGVNVFFYFIEQHSQVFVKYLRRALYAHPLWFYKHQHDNQVRSKQFVAY